MAGLVEDAFQIKEEEIQFYSLDDRLYITGERVQTLLRLIKQ